MQLVLDTNVLMSGIFWSGAPSIILEAWLKNRFELIISPDILNEYLRIVDILNKKYPKIDIIPIIEMLAIKSKLYQPDQLEQPVSRDPDVINLSKFVLLLLVFLLPVEIKIY